MVLCRGSWLGVDVGMPAGRFITTVSFAPRARVRWKCCLSEAKSVPVRAASLTRVHVRVNLKTSRGRPGSPGRPKMVRFRS